jgi:HEAT repeat protein
VVLGAEPKKEELVGLLSAEAAPTRRTAAYVLGCLKDKSTAPALKERIPKETDPKVTAVLLEAVRKVGE